MQASFLTEEIIRDTALYDSIAMYLRPGETTKEMITKHGTVVKAIQYLRQRGFPGDKVQEPNILDPIHDPKYEDAEVQSKKSKSKPSKSKGKPQKGLLF